MPFNTGHDSPLYSDPWRLFSDGADGSRFVWLGEEGFEGGAEATQQCGFATATRTSRGDPRGEATASEPFALQAQPAVSATKLLAADAAWNPQQQGAQGVESEVGTRVRGRLHHHAEFLRRGVLRVRLNFRRAQRSSSAKTSQRFQDFLQPIRKLFLRITLARRAAQACQPLR